MAKSTPRRIIFGLFWFAILWVAFSVIGAGIMSSFTGAPPPSPGSNVAIAPQTASAFQERYGWATVAAAVFVTIIVVWRGWLPGTRP
jgi:hypothetical protein